MSVRTFGLRAPACVVEGKNIVNFTLGFSLDLFELFIKLRFVKGRRNGRKKQT